MKTDTDKLKASVFNFIKEEILLMLIFEHDN